MAQAQKSKQFKRILFSRTMLVVLLLLALFLSYSAINLFLKRNEVWAKAKTAHKTYLDLESKRETLENHIRALETPEGVEAALREKYHVVKSGEGVVIITNPENASNQADLHKTTLWGKIKQFFTAGGK